MLNCLLAGVVMSWLDSAFGVYPQALAFRSQRNAVLAANIANSDTPDFKARDYNFKDALKDVVNGQNLKMTTTHSKHAISSGDEDFGALMYRVPTRYSVNGNTVESEVEQAAYSENAVHYQTSLQFLNGAISGLRLAIKGQ